MCGRISRGMSPEATRNFSDCDFASRAQNSYALATSKVPAGIDASRTVLDAYDVTPPCSLARAVAIVSGCDRARSDKFARGGSRPSVGLEQIFDRSRRRVVMPIHHGLDMTRNVHETHA